MVKTIVKHLLHFFTAVSLPMEVQSDRGINFTSYLFEQIVNELNQTWRYLSFLYKFQES